MGGISLGAAVAVNVAIRYPDRLIGLVLSRPAWIHRPLPKNVILYTTIARLDPGSGPEGGAQPFSERQPPSRRWNANRRIPPDR